MYVCPILVFKNYFPLLPHYFTCLVWFWMVYSYILNYNYKCMSVIPFICPLGTVRGETGISHRLFKIVLILFFGEIYPISEQLFYYRIHIFSTILLYNPYFFLEIQKASLLMDFVILVFNFSDNIIWFLTSRETTSSHFMLP